MSEQTPPPEKDGFWPEGYTGGDKDPFPKMIVVCICISAVLFVIIALMLVFDFIQRSERTNVKEVNQKPPVITVPAPSAPADK